MAFLRTAPPTFRDTAMPNLACANSFFRQTIRNAPERKRFPRRIAAKSADVRSLHAGEKSRRRA